MPTGEIDTSLYATDGRVDDESIERIQRDIDALFERFVTSFTPESPGLETPSFHAQLSPRPRSPPRVQATGSNGMSNTSSYNVMPGRSLGWRHTFGAKRSDDVSDYIRRFEQYAVGCNWDETTKVSSFISTLTGRASQLVSTLSAQSSWGTVVEHLRDEWEPEELRRALRDSFLEIKRRRQESAEEFLQRITSLAIRAYVDYPSIP